MFQRIDAQKAKELIDDQEALVIDIRDPGSFNMGHITGAVLIDNSNVQQFIAEADHSKPLIVCCYHGNSSQPAAGFMSEQGFSQSFSLDGGFEHWKVIYPDQVSGS
jgi:thiosulfate sulfurtransferase